VRNEPDQIFFPNLVIFSRASPVGVIYKGVKPYVVARLASTVSRTLPCGLSHTARVAPSDMAWLSHANPFGMTGRPRLPRPSSSFFLPPLFTLWWLHWWFGISLSYLEPVTPQIDSMSWYPNHVGYVRHFYRFISLYFKILLEWTHVVGIWESINVIMISMKWLCCMND
jgi:hypothetical protein